MTLFNTLRAVLFLLMLVPCALFAETALLIQREARIEHDNDLDGFCSRLEETADRENLKILDCGDEDSAVILCEGEGISRLAVINVKRNDLVRTRVYSKYITRTFVEKLYTLSVTITDIKTGDKSTIFQDNGVAADSIKGLSDLVVYSLLYKTQEVTTPVASGDAGKNFRIKKFGMGVSVVWVNPKGVYADILGSAFGGAFKFSAYPFENNNITASVEANLARCFTNAVSISSAHFASAFLNAGYTFFRERTMSLTPQLGAGYVFNIINGKETYYISSSGRFSYNPGISASLEFSLNIFSGSSFILTPKYAEFFGQKESCRYFELSGGVTSRF